MNIHLILGIINFILLVVTIILIIWKYKYLPKIFLKQFFNNQKLKYKIAKIRRFRKKDIKKIENKFKAKEKKFNLREKILNLKIKNQKKSIKTLNKKLKFKKERLKELDVYSKDISFSLFQRIKEKLFNKPSYYVAYISPSYTLKIYGVKKDIKTFIKNNSMHTILYKICFFRGKPLYLVHFDIIQSLIIDEKMKSLIIWNPKETLNIIQYQIRKKLTQSESLNLSEWIKKNWLVLVIIIGLVLFFSSSYGKEFITSLMTEWGLNK